MSADQIQPTVLITGAAGGIGRATVELFLEKGWRVLALDIAAPDPALPDGVDFYHCDLASPDEINALCDRLKPELKAGLQALVNNAAYQITDSLLDTELEAWDQVQAVNLRAPFLLTTGLYPALKAAQGAVVNVASVHALATSPEIGAYAASKGGLLALTRTMGIEFAQDRVRANAVLPGATDTAMLQAGLDREEVSAKGEIASRIQLGRLARPAEVAQAIYFLADPEQSSYITGQPLVVDGGALAKLSIE